MRVKKKKKCNIKVRFEYIRPIKNIDITLTKY